MKLTTSLCEAAHKWTKKLWIQLRMATFVPEKDLDDKIVC